MTRLLTCGWETGDLNEAGVSTIGSYGSLAVVSSNPAPRTGTGAYVLKAMSNNVLNAFAWKRFNLASPVNDVWVRFAAYFHVTGGVDMGFASWADSAGGEQTRLVYSSAEGYVQLRAGTSIIIANSSVPIGQDVWHLMEWRTQITSTAVGVTELWVDGNRIINYSGDNTGSSQPNVRDLGLGTIGDQPSTYIAFDDVAVNDTSGTVNNGRPGDGRIILLLPNGTNTALFTRAGTDTGSNHGQVNEIPPSMAQRVESDNVGTRDLYTLDDLPVTPSTVNTVEAIALGQNSDVGGGSIGLTLKSGATIAEAAPSPLFTSAQYVRAAWQTDPNTGAPWTAAAVNALLAGPTVR